MCKSILRHRTPSSFLRILNYGGNKGMLFKTRVKLTRSQSSHL